MLGLVFGLELGGVIVRVRGFGLGVRVRVGVRL